MTNDLECENLSKRFGPFTAVDSVSFEIASGSFFTILGPSGCGKTTLMRMIAGFEEPASGDIRINGRSVLGQSGSATCRQRVCQYVSIAVVAVTIQQKIYNHTIKPINPFTQIQNT